MAFRDVRNFLLISHADGIIDDEEFIVLYDLYSSRDPDFPYHHYTAFDLDALDESETTKDTTSNKKVPLVVKIHLAASKR